MSAPGLFAYGQLQAGSVGGELGGVLTLGCRYAGGKSAGVVDPHIVGE